jgi:hypothetical protein
MEADSRSHLSVLEEGIKGRERKIKGSPPRRPISLWILQIEIGNEVF